MPKITTILPTFRRPKLLARAIESVLNQTYKNFVLSIYDNNSQDETLTIATAYQKRDCRIQIFSRPINIGGLENFAQGLANVKTPFFSFLSDDDYLLPCFYETNLKAFETYPEAGFTASRTLMTDTKGKLSLLQFMYPTLSGYYPAGDAAIKLASSTWFPIWTSIVFKTAALDHIGTLDRKAGYVLDMDFILRYACCTPCVLINKPTACLMTWPQASSLSYATIQESNYDAIMENTTKLFVGSTEQKRELITHLLAMKNRWHKHTWIAALASHDIQQARYAKERYLSNGGRESRWKVYLLSLAEKMWMLRKLLAFYLHIKKMMRQIKGFLRKVQDKEVHS